MPHFILLLFFAQLLSAQGIPKHEKKAISYRLQEMNEYDAASYFIQTLGCKKISKEGEPSWDSEIFVWEMGNRIQKGEFTLGGLMEQIERAFEKDYKFKDALTEWAPISKHLKPENSTDLNVYLEDRREFLDILKNLLQPFEDERAKESSALKTPSVYANSYATYKERLKKLNEWKTKFSKKMDVLCPQFYTRPDDKSASYRSSVHSRKLQDEHSPPLDILASRFVNSLGCDDFVTSLPFWYVGERLKRGDFSHQQWDQALDKELTAAVDEDKLEDDDKDHIVENSKKILGYFQSTPSLRDPLPRSYLPSSEDPVVKNFREIRESEVKFTNWLTLQKNIEKNPFPCDSKYSFAKTALHQRAGELFDKAAQGKVTATSFCSAQKDNLEKKYEKEFKKLKGEMETLFYGADVRRDEPDSPFSPEHKIEDISRQLQSELSQATGNVKALSAKTIQNAIETYKSHLKQLNAHSKKGEDRVPDFLFQKHIDDVTRLWTSRYLLGDGDPSNENDFKEFENEVGKLKRSHALQMVLACLESDGRLYFSSTHSNESISTGFPPLREDKDWVSDITLALNLIKERKELELKAPHAHHFDEETNWSGGQISYNQVSQTNPAGRFYYSEIARIMGVTKDQKKLNREKTLSAISQKCYLDKLFKHAGKRKEEEILAASEQLFERMNRSLNGYQYSHSSFEVLDDEEKFSVLEDFAIIQKFCAPLHLGLTEAVFNHNRGYFGSLDKDKNRTEVCANVGNVDKPNSPALNDISSGLIATLKENHPKINPNTTQSSDKIKALAKDFSRANFQLKNENKAAATLEELKNDKDITKYFTSLASSPMHEAWKLFTISEQPLLGWNDDFAAPTAENITRSQKEFIDIAAGDKDFAVKKEAFLKSQKERRNRSLFALNLWIHKKQEHFDPVKRNDFSRAMNPLRDRFEALHDLYDQYERELVDQMRNCRSSFPSESDYQKVLPNYNPPPPKAIPVKKSKPSNSSTTLVKTPSKKSTKALPKTSVKKKKK